MPCPSDRGPIVEALAKLNVSGAYGKSSDQLTAIADVWIEDLRATGETQVSLIVDAIDEHRRYKTTWPKLAEIRETMARLRKTVARPALPEATGSITPGMGSLAALYKMAKLPLREYEIAAANLESRYANYCTRGERWPLGRDVGKDMELLRVWTGIDILCEAQEAQR